MNGLASPSPSQSAVRLALGGFLLLIVQSLLLLLAPAADLRGLVRVLTLIAVGALVASLIGPPEPPKDLWRRRHEG